MGNNIIRFQLGNENYPVIETLNEKEIFEKSIFKDQYLHAFETIERHFLDLRPSSEDGCEEKNNIFAFLGDRGSGKTSCMKSVARVLCESKDKKAKIFCNAGIDCPALLERTFIPLDMIDPSFFDDKHNILEVLIAQLFKAFRKRCESDINRIASIDQQKLSKRFQTAQKDMRNMFDNNDEHYSSVERLQNLSAAVDLRKDIYELVQMYCLVMGYGENAILVVRVDDIDLNTSQAARMAEEIRKYFVQQNIIVLMALKYEQMDMVKQLEFAKEYEKLLRDEAADVICDMSRRYLVKLLPEDQHIYMPEGRFISTSKLQLMKPDNTPDLGFENESTLLSVADYITDTIYEKTGYVFFNNPQRNSYIVPQNLRDLRQLIKLLHGMKARTTLVNQQIFQNYLFNSFSTQVLGMNSIKAVSELRELSTGVEINAHVIRLVLSRYHYNILEQLADEEIKFILDFNNVKENISFGDIMALIDYVEKRVSMKEDLSFLFLIKALYTFKMHEFASYDNMTELKRLIGGRYFNTRYFKHLPSSTILSRAYMRIDLQSVYNIWNLCSSNTNINQELLYVLQFYYLGISRKYDRTVATSNSEVMDFDYRKKQRMSIDESFSSGQKNVIFDINAIMYHLIDQQSCFRRFHSDVNVFSLTAPSYLLDYEEIQKLNNELLETRFDRVGGEDINIYIQYLNKLVDYKCKNGTQPFSCLYDLKSKLSLFLDKKPNDTDNPALDLTNPYTAFMTILKSGLEEQKKFHDKYSKTHVFGRKHKYTINDILKCVNENAPELKTLDLWKEWWLSINGKDEVISNDVNAFIVKVNEHLSSHK